MKNQDKFHEIKPLHAFSKLGEQDTASANRMRNGFKVTDQMIVDSIGEGSEDKFFISVDGTRYLVKDSSFNKNRKRSSLAPYCEYVGSNFIRLSGLLSCQKTWLGTYNSRQAVICEDLFKSCVFRPFKELHQSSAGTDLGNKEYTYDDVLYVLEMKEKLKGSEFSDFKQKFWLMFLFDAVLGNRDRHEGNWGFVKRNSITTLASIFDNGSSLFPDVDLSDWKHCQFVRDRVYKILESQFKMWKNGIYDRPVRTNFYEIITQSSQIFKDEMALVQNLDYQALIELSTTDVPESTAEWFRVIIECRFRALILGEDFDAIWRDPAGRNGYDLY